MGSWLAIMIDFRRRKSPKILYKYCPINKNSIQSLKDKKIWMGTPENLNDPYDMQIDYFPVRQNEIRNRHLNKLVNIPLDYYFISNMEEAENGDPVKIGVKTFPTGQLGVDGLLSMLQNPEALSMPNAISGVFCVSEVGLNPTMWSHYADHGAGMMIELAVKNVRAIDRIFRIGDLDFAPVKYVRKMPRQTILDWLDDYHKSRLRSCLTKFKDWSYEREWRLIGNKGDYLADNPFDVLSISIGPYSTLSDRRKVFSLCKELNVQFYLCAKNPIEYGYIAIKGVTDSLLDYFDEIDINEHVKRCMGLRKDGFDQVFQSVEVSRDDYEHPSNRKAPT